MTKSEIGRVTKLFHRLETDGSGAVPLSGVTKLLHFKNNTLVKMVASQYARQQHSIRENTSEESAKSDREEVMDLKSFIELFDILSPKKDSSSKLEGIQL